MDIEKLKDYEDYFNADITAIDEELKKSKEYSSLIDNEIEKLKSSSSNGTNRGAQHYLIEHIKNAVSLQSQRQSLRKDKFSIKKAIMDYGNKFENTNDDNTISIVEQINSILALENRKKEKPKILDSEKIDVEIEKILNSENNDN
jgi:hypothetical protein